MTKRKWTLAEALTGYADGNRDRRVNGVLVPITMHWLLCDEGLIEYSLANATYRLTKKGRAILAEGASK